MSRPLFPLALLILTVVSSHAQDLAGLPPELQEAIERGLKMPAPPPLSANDPLSIARELSLHITGDEDKACAMQFRVSQSLVSAGRHDEAAALAAQISDYRGALARIHLARAMLAAGGVRETAEAPLALAEKQLPETKPWQQELIRAALHQAGLEFGWEPQRLTAMLEPVRDQEILIGAKVAALAREARLKGAFDHKAAEEWLGGLQGPAPVLLDAARELFAVALDCRSKKNAASTKQAEEFTDQALGLLRRSKVAHIEELIDAATTLVEAGFEQEAKKLFLLTEGRLGGETEHTFLLHYKMTRLWRLRGKQESLRPMLEKSEQQARAQRQMDRPFALSWIAAAWWQAGDGLRAERCVVDAGHEAGTNVNPRMRLVGAIDICLVHAHEKRSLSQPVFEVIQNIAQGKQTE
ncbi:MAG: hypothetical protein Q8M07_03045 [Prosthecobacter sp.]|nr:hypothetical protein [Prosthecobacter sp.]